MRVVQTYLQAEHPYAEKNREKNTRDREGELRHDGGGIGEMRRRQTLAKMKGV